MQNNFHFLERLNYKAESNAITATQEKSNSSVVS